MAALKARVEALEAKGTKADSLCAVTLMTHLDPRVNEPCPEGPSPKTVTRVVIVPLTAKPTTQGAANGNA